MGRGDAPVNPFATGAATEARVSQAELARDILVETFQRLGPARPGQRVAEAGR